LSETSFSKIKNKKVIWGGTLKWDTLYNDNVTRMVGRLIRGFQRLDIFINQSLAAKELTMFYSFDEEFISSSFSFRNRCITRAYFTYRVITLLTRDVACQAIGLPSSRAGYLGFLLRNWI